MFAGLRQLLGFTPASNRSSTQSRFRPVELPLEINSASGECAAVIDVDQITIGGLQFGMSAEIPGVLHKEVVFHQRKGTKEILVEDLVKFQISLYRFTESGCEFYSFKVPSHLKGTRACRRYLKKNAPKDLAPWRTDWPRIVFVSAEEMKIASFNEEEFYNWPTLNFGPLMMCDSDVFIENQLYPIGSAIDHALHDEGIKIFRESGTLLIRDLCCRTSHDIYLNTLADLYVISRAKVQVMEGWFPPMSHGSFWQHAYPNWKQSFLPEKNALNQWLRPSPQRRLRLMDAIMIVIVAAILATLI